MLRPYGKELGVMTYLGVALVALAGLIIGSGAWPMKLMKRFEFEHWWFVGMGLALIVIPWTSTLVLCDRALEAYRSVPVWMLVKSNLFALGWGIANVLVGICFTRIGVALTGAITTGLGVSVGVTLPLVMKGSGLFHNAADISSRAGLTILAGVAIMLIGVAFVTAAGFGRDRALRRAEPRSGKFAVDLSLCVIAGVLSCGMGLAFVYCQGPVVAAMKLRGAADIPANLAVWAGGLLAGALLNVIYPAYLMTRKRSWNVLVQSWRELGLSMVIGIGLSLGIVLTGKGMLLLGALGASVGFGIQQAAQMMGNQGLGFVSGEWRGVHGKPRVQMLVAIVILIAAAVVMAYGNAP
jgi:hypothetical protein